MVKFQINDKQYQTPEGWHDVAFDKFLQSLTDLEPKRPIALNKFLEEHGEAIAKLDDKLTDNQKELEAVRLFEERWEGIPSKEKIKIHKFFSIAVGFWCDIPSTLIRESMNLDELEQTFWTIEYELNPNNAEIDEQWAGFELNGIEYLPPSKHMEESTVAEFAESAQFQENMRGILGGDWLAMQDVMVVLCRPKGEVYEYQKGRHELRKKLFKKVTMDHVINTAFFLLRLNKILKHNLLIYTMEQDIVRKEQELLGNVMGGTM